MEKKESFKGHYLLANTYPGSLPLYTKLYPDPKDPNLYTCIIDDVEFTFDMQELCQPFWLYIKNAECAQLAHNFIEKVTKYLNNQIKAQWQEENVRLNDINRRKKQEFQSRLQPPNDSSTTSQKLSKSWISSEVDRRMINQMEQMQIEAALMRERMQQRAWYEEPTASPEYLLNR